MRIFNILRRGITNPLWFISGVIMRCPQLIKDDKQYLKWFYYHTMLKWPDLDNPKTYNEKLNWLKLHNKHAEYTKMVDKVAVKEFVASIIGEEYVVPTYGVWNDVSEVDINSLPQQFVLKSNHDSGGIVVCKDKSKLNFSKARKKFNKQLSTNYYWATREYPYVDVVPKIFAEKFLVDETGCGLKDYKFFCFGGKAKLLFVATDRDKGPHHTKFDFFDLNWNHLSIRNGHENNPNPITKPKNFEKMIEIADKLSSAIDSPQVRIDLYNCDGQIYFGEITFFHWGGVVPFEPEEWDYKLGDMIHLPEIC